jgi:hypothetical protein
MGTYDHDEDASDGWIKRFHDDEVFLVTKYGYDHPKNTLYTTKPTPTHTYPSPFFLS